VAVAPAELYGRAATREGQRVRLPAGTIKENIVWYDKSWVAGPCFAELVVHPSMVQSANAAHFCGYAGTRMPPSQLSGQPCLWTWDVWAIMKGTPNKDLAMDFHQFHNPHSPTVRDADVGLWPATPLGSGLLPDRREARPAKPPTLMRG